METKWYRVNATRLNLRNGPGLSFAVIAFLHHNNRVEAMGYSNDKYWLYVKTSEEKYGWLAGKYLLEIPQPTEDDNYPWLGIALSELGEKEIPGELHNPRIVEYLKSTTLGKPYNEKDETPWCSAFVNWCVEKSGFEGTDSAWARGWMNWGVAIAEPQRGCIAVFTRGNAGHVAFFLELDGENIRVLGGNQQNSVSIAVYKADRLLGYRKM